METDVAQPAWQLTSLFDEPAGVAHHEGHWTVVVGRRSAAGATLDEALEAVDPSQDEPAVDSR